LRGLMTLGPPPPVQARGRGPIPYRSRPSHPGAACPGAPAARSDRRKIVREKHSN
jgi:hypothetical protein